MKLTYSGMLAAILFVLALCDMSVAQAPQDIYGAVEDGRYVNNFLKFQLSVPDGWQVVESDEQKAVKQIGRTAIRTGDVKADALIDQSFKNDVIVLFVSEKPVGSIDNSVFGMSITKLPAKGYTPKMLAESFKTTLAKNPKNRVINDVSLEIIGGQSWANVLIDLDFFGQPVHTNYFVTVIGDYALVANMSYHNSEQLKKMDAAFRGIKFAAK